MSHTTTNEGLHDTVSATLGSVLYADPSKIRVSEREWVALVRSIAAGDQAALHALYERTHRIVFTLILRITSNRQTSEELTVDVFHDVWRRASSYDAAGGTVVGWIMNQARSRAIDRLRFDQRKKRVSPHAGEASPRSREHLLQAGTQNDSLDVLALKEQGVRLRGALLELSPEERAVIECAFFSGMTYSEVAARLNQPLGTVKTRIRSGLAKLRLALGDGAAEL